MRKIQRAAKATFTEDTEFSAAMQVPLGGLGGLLLQVYFEHRDTETLRFFRVRKFHVAVDATPKESLACAHAIPPEGILDKSLIYLFNR